MMRTVALVTDSRQPDLSQSDRLLVEPLLARGIQAAPAPWDQMEPGLFLDLAEPLGALRFAEAIARVIG